MPFVLAVTRNAVKASRISARRQKRIIGSIPDRRENDKPKEVMMGNVVPLNIRENFVTEVCFKCACIFAMSETMYNEMRRTHETFYCPSGHNQHYTSRSKEQILRDKLRVMEEDRDGWRRQEEKRTRQLSAARGVTTRIKNRIGHGVCPCCQRSFQNIKRHMACKHPDYLKDK